jgi:hypothetical protein
VAQVAECLPSKCKALSSDPKYCRNIKKKIKNKVGAHNCMAQILQKLSILLRTKSTLTTTVYVSLSVTVLLTINLSSSPTVLLFVHSAHTTLAFCLFHKDVKHVPPQDFVLVLLGLITFLLKSYSFLRNPASLSKSEHYSAIQFIIHLSCLSSLHSTHYHPTL